MNDEPLREDPELERRIQAALDKVNNAELREALGAFRLEYSTFAHRNARRLDLINAAYRKLVQVVVVVGVLYAVVQVALGVLGLNLEGKTQDSVRQIQVGRRIALSVSCATLSAIAAAGRQVIAGPAVAPPPGEERAYEKLGFPPFKVRHRAQQAEADGYVKQISKQIDARIGRTGDHLVAPDGTIDCQRYATLARLR